MKLPLLLLTLFSFVALHAADLPTVSVEHLYYLQTRSIRVSKFKPDEMIDYCLAQKLGGNAFESLYFQLFTNRIEVTRLLKVEQVDAQDPRIILLNKTFDVLSKTLEDEARKIQNGIISEGQIATDSLETIARSQGTPGT